MDTLRDLALLLALLLLGSARCAEELEPVLKAVGDSMEMGFCFGVDYIVGYKLVGEKRQLVGNSSSESPRGLLSGRVSITNHLASLLGLEITNLTSADSGVYLRECWRDHQLMNQQKHYLYVCGEEAGVQEIFVSPDGGADFACNTSSTGLPGSSILWFREVYPKYKATLFLDTEQSLTPVQPELKEQIQVRDGGASLHIPSEVMKDSRNFHCLVLRSGQCLAFQNIELPESEEPDVKTVFRSEGESVQLTCPMKHPEQKKRFWETPFGMVESSAPVETTEGNHISVLEGQRAGEYSLLISKLTENSAGDYKCFAPLLVADYAVTVCPKHETTEVEFSEGGEVVLECMLQEGQFSVQWYRQNGSHEETLLSDSGDPSIDFPQDLQDRAAFSEEKFTLTISRLTPKDNRTYWCVVLEEIVFTDEDYTDVSVEGNEDNAEVDAEVDTNDDVAGESGEFGNTWEEEDKCLSRRVIHLVYKASLDPTGGSGKSGSGKGFDKDGPDKGRSLPSPGPDPFQPGPEPEPEATTNPLVFAVAGGVIGLIVVGAVIAIVFKMRAKKNHEQAGKVECSIEKGEVAGLAPEKNRP
ncbi:uncharacterized protein LOC121724236 [Alosa sapidissima]|uniref:uncharacterized protein LOC121724236 n=1 Tax=Alosa sapidissima TaxID=34773 RepID=UPI001C083EC6|nr:uncharacterized protein LOC121724236 [Alosa sapidissima]